MHTTPWPSIGNRQPGRAAVKPRCMPYGRQSRWLSIGNRPPGRAAVHALRGAKPLAEHRQQAARQSRGARPTGGKAVGRVSAIMDTREPIAQLDTRYLSTHTRLADLLVTCGSHVTHAILCERDRLSKHFWQHARMGLRGGVRDCFSTVSASQTRGKRFKQSCTNDSCNEPYIITM